MQQKLTQGPLLDAKGYLVEAGYHTRLVKDYQRDMIKVRGMRIKAWDYYYVGNDHYGVAFTIADNDYLWLTSVTFFNFDEAFEKTNTKIGWFPRGKLNLPNTSQKGDIRIHKKHLDMSFLVEGKKRHLIVNIKNFKKGVDFYANLILTPTIKDTMVIATPFKKPGYFYYNQKMNLLKAEGSVVVGHHAFDFGNTQGVLDWGRGVWTYNNTWYWSSLSGFKGGHRIGFNLGYGFGDTSKATENMVFFDDETYKMDDVVFEITRKGKKDDFMAPWRIRSKDERIHLMFTPILDRASNTNILIIQSDQHQVFGTFDGSIKVTEHKTIVIDHMIGFAEKVKNRW